MKRFFIAFLTLLMWQPMLNAATPYTLEGIKALNVLVIDQSNAISPETENKILTELRQKLEKNGIKSNKDGVGALFVKITSVKVGTTTVSYVNLGIGEEAEIDRSPKVKSFALTYSFDDMVESEHIDADVYDSVVNFLIVEFLEQYREDNEE